MHRLHNGSITEVISPDEIWRLVLDDSHGNTAGCRSHGNGSVTLFNTKQGHSTFKSHVVRRPMDGDVSNTGRCAIHDAGWSSLEGTVLVLETDGKIVYRREFSANILSVSISPSGRYVLAQTLHAPESPDSELVEVLDLDTGDIPIKTRRKTANPSRYIVEETADGALNRVTALVPKLGEFSYSADGIFIDEYSYMLAQIDGENVYESVLAMGELLKRNDHSAAKKIIESAPKIIGLLRQRNSKWAAKALRYLGESFELLNRSADAVIAYRQALSMDSTVGVKRRIERIESA